MSGLTSLTLTTCGADVRQRRAEADLPTERHQAGPADGRVLTEQRTTRCDGQALASSSRNAIFFSIFSGPARVAARSLAGCSGELCRSSSRELEKTHAIGDN